MIKIKVDPWICGNIAVVDLRNILPKKYSGMTTPQNHTMYVMGFDLSKKTTTLRNSWGDINNIVTVSNYEPSFQRFWVQVEEMTWVGCLEEEDRVVMKNIPILKWAKNEEGNYIPKL